MGKSTKGSNPDHITVEEAASILGVGQSGIQQRFTDGLIKKLRASNGEIRVSKAEVERAAYFEAILVDWPEPTDAQRKFIEYQLSGGVGPAPSTGPSSYELEQRRKAQEREDALKEARKAAMALTACDVCNLQPEVHEIRRAQRIDMHEWVPGRAEKVMARG
jgi:hypothetical protein